MEVAKAVMSPEMQSRRVCDDTSLYENRKMVKIMITSFTGDALPL